MLRKLGIETAYQFREREREWVEAAFSKPCRELYEELHGNYIHRVNASVSQHEQISISRTRTFTPASTDKSFIYAQLSKNVELACARLRSHGYFARWMSFFLKTQEFRYYRIETRLPEPVSTPESVLSVVRDRFDEIYRRGILYRASGITLGDLTRAQGLSGNLFVSPEEASKPDRLYEAVDSLAHRYGGDPVFLASSFKARAGERPEGKRFALPFLGSAS